jgi:O-antigen ligase
MWKRALAGGFYTADVDSALRRIAGWTALTLAAVVLAWQVVRIEPVQAGILLAAGAGVVLWLLSPGALLLVLAGISPFALSFRVAGLVDVRVQDALLAILALTAAYGVLAGRLRLDSVRTPLARFCVAAWMFLAVWGTLTYFLGTANQWLLQDPLRNTWYVYRAVWRALLPFPLMLLFVNQLRERGKFVGPLVAALLGVSAYALWEANVTGENAAGPYESKNALAGFLILVSPFVTTRLILESGRKRRLVWAGILLLMLRTLWRTGSRGGFVAFVASLLPLVLLLPRRRLLAAGVLLAVLIALLPLVRADLLDRPMVRRYVTLAAPTQVQNFQWRQSQWGVFMERIMESPWIGTGSDVDRELLEEGRLGTAHNGFLAVAVRSGIPMAVTWVLLLGMLLIGQWRRAVRVESEQERGFRVATLGFLVALVAHNLVEATITGTEVQHVFWILTAAALIEPEESKSPEEHA